jgi:hypothetical protein
LNSLKDLWYVASIDHANSAIRAPEICRLAIRSSELVGKRFSFAEATEDTILRSKPPSVGSERKALIGFNLPKMAIGKCVAGTAFKITLEMLRLC